MNTIKRITVLLLFALLVGCSTTPKKIDTTNLKSIEALNAEDINNSATSTSNLRNGALEETALSFGAQSGLAYRANIIDKNLEKNALYLRNVFNIGALVLDHNVLPPVLTQANNTLNYAGPNVLRISDKTYKIKQQAKFVTTAPTWQDYLWMNFKKPEVPHKTLLPKSEEEEKTWKKYIRIGWKNGENQARAIFSENLARLKQDYSGMLLYRELLSKKMISKPYVAEARLGVTGDANTLNINDQVLRITSTPQLQTNSKEWKPILVE
jgi:defect-in-organelle-trafficking protein DotC